MQNSRQYYHSTTKKVSYQTRDSNVLNQVYTNIQEIYKAAETLVWLWCEVTAQDAAFRSGDMLVYRAAWQDLKKAIREAMGRYRHSVSSTIRWGLPWGLLTSTKRLAWMALDSHQFTYKVNRSTEDSVSSHSAQTCHMCSAIYSARTHTSELQLCLQHHNPT